MLRGPLHCYSVQIFKKGNCSLTQESSEGKRKNWFSFFHQKASPIMAVSKEKNVCGIIMWESVLVLWTQKIFRPRERREKQWVMQGSHGKEKRGQRKGLSHKGVSGLQPLLKHGLQNFFATIIQAPMACHCTCCLLMQGLTTEVGFWKMKQLPNNKQATHKGKLEIVTPHEVPHEQVFKETSKMNFTNNRLPN